MAEKTILIVGTVEWEGGLTASYHRTFKALGFQVEVFDLDAERARVAPFGRLGHRLMYHLDFLALNAKANRRLVMAATRIQPDLIVVICNAFVRAGTLLQIKVNVPSARVINIFPDPLHNVHDYVVAALPLYDLFCTHTRAAVPYLYQMGCNKPFYLPLAADPLLHYPMPLSKEDNKVYGCDLVYVGNWRPEHEQLFSALEEFDLAIWGPHYWGRNTQKGSWVRTRWRKRSLMTGAEYIKAHLAAKVCLNPIDPINRPSHNQRLFEVPACGAFSLVSRTDEVLALFQEGETVACFNDAQELVEKVHYYLAHVDDRQRIARQAHEYVIRHGHTYIDRCRTILNELGLR